ncbi:flagellar protein FlaG [Pseudidiomarina sp.]|uniref:flagellar protein FlaG n=1 Tax=Pseudidiomarina sp. TaxID=2081707 RepID=UPI00299E695E|nr:flagellar protein FlaG [Pseudidiomarina sp.]MDX1705753.1 flagellar protein FlaG [Pseudidiomarina sp.]
MTTPMNELSYNNWPAAYAAAERQRMERVLQQLPMPKSSAEPQQYKAAELVSPVQRINQVMENYGLHFDLSEQAGGKVVIKLVSRDSGEVIRQIPSEEMLRIAEHLDEIKGLLLQQQA